MSSQRRRSFASSFETNDNGTITSSTTVLSAGNDGTSDSLSEVLAMDQDGLNGMDTGG